MTQSRLIFLFSAIFLFGFFGARAQPASEEKIWLTSFEEAQKLAQTFDKPILMLFSGSDWCKPCITQSKEVWETEKFKQYASENLVMVQFDFPRFTQNQLPADQLKYNEQQADAFNPEGTVPLVILLSPDGKILGKTTPIKGGPDAYIAFINNLLKK